MRSHLYKYKLVQLKSIRLNSRYGLGENHHYLKMCLWKMTRLEITLSKKFFTYRNLKTLQVVFAMFHWFFYQTAKSPWNFPFKNVRDCLKRDISQINTPVSSTQKGFSFLAPKLRQYNTKPFLGWTDALLLNSQILEAKNEWLLC